MPKGVYKRSKKHVSILRRNLGEAGSKQIKKLNAVQHEAGHPRWKGENCGYTALHNWVRKRLGTPRRCDHCGRADRERYEWANVSGEYRRVLTDWIRLCKSCHVKFDGQPKLKNGQWAKKI